MAARDFREDHAVLSTTVRAVSLACNFSRAECLARGVSSAPLSILSVISPTTRPLWLGRPVNKPNDLENSRAQTRALALVETATSTWSRLTDPHVMVAVVIATDTAQHIHTTSTAQQTNTSTVHGTLRSR